VSTRDVGDAVKVTYSVVDEDGDPVNASTCVLTVTKPDLTTSTPTVSNPETGEYEADWLYAAAGRHIFTWVTTVPNTTESTVVYAVAPTALPTLAVVKDYLGTTSATDAEITAALAAETAAQDAVCRVEAYYPPDLAEALKRRVARNLALRGIPLAVLQGDAEGGSLVLPRLDVEVRRLEGPHRKLIAG
jgi:hypothetical protein